MVCFDLVGQHKLAVAARFRQLAHHLCHRAERSCASVIRSAGSGSRERETGDG